MVIQSSKSEKISRRRLSSHPQAWFMANNIFGCGKVWYHFQQDLMVGKTVDKLFINSFIMGL